MSLSKTHLAFIESMLRVYKRVSKGATGEASEDSQKSSTEDSGQAAE